MAHELCTRDCAAATQAALAAAAPVPMAAAAQSPTAPAAPPPMLPATGPTVPPAAAPALPPAAAPTSLLAAAPVPPPAAALPAASLGTAVSAPLVSFDVTVVPMGSSSASDIKATLINAISAAVAPVPVVVTIAGTMPTSAGRRRLLQSPWSLQATVNFTVGNLTASVSEADVSAIVAHDVAAYLAPVAVATSEVASASASGPEYAFIVQLPPSNQLGGQPAGFGALRASDLTDALQHAPSRVLATLAAVSGFTVASIDTKVAVVHAQAGPAAAAVIPPLPAMQGQPAAQPAATQAAPPAAAPTPMLAPAVTQPLLYTVRVAFPASQPAAAQALLNALTASSSVFPSTLAVSVSNAALSYAMPQAADGSTGAAIESFQGQVCARMLQGVSVCKYACASAHASSLAGGMGPGRQQRFGWLAVRHVDGAVSRAAGPAAVQHRQGAASCCAEGHASTQLSGC